MRLRLIGLDAFETLFCFRRPPADTYYQLARRHGLILQAQHHDARQIEIMQRSLMRALHEQMLHSPNYHVDDNCGNFSTSSRPWWRQVVCRTLELGGIDKPNRAPQFDEYFEHLFQYFSTAEPYKLYPDTELALKRLRELHPTACLACLSNSDERLRSILDGLGIAGDFDLILDSRSIGSKKPDQKFFSTAMFKSGVDGLEPMECLYIGDDMERDYLGALNAGWNAKLLNRNVSTTAQVKSTISSLLDI